MEIHLDRGQHLAALNRLDEAEQMVAQLADDRGSSACDLELIRSLLDARRSLATAALNLPAGSHELLVPSACGGAATKNLPADFEAVVEMLRRRTRERVREEYGRFFNLVLLELHHGHRERAAILCAELAAWVKQIDSRLIAARQAHLWALVYHFANDVAAARNNAEIALRMYTELGNTSDQWAMRGILGWSLRLGGASKESIDRNRKRRTELGQQVLCRLSAADRALYSLNKWSAIDEEVSATCHDLRLRLKEHKRRSGRRRRAAQRALREILCIRRLDSRVEKRQQDLHGDDAEPDHKDVYRLALESVRRRLATGGKPALTKLVARRWLPADTAVLHYVVLPDRVELFLLTRAGCELIPLRQNTTRPHLWEMTQACLRKLKRGRKPWLATAARHRVRPGAPRSDLAICLGLPDVLEHLGDDIKHLAIVPDDILAHVPFAALPVHKNPLIERFSVALMPSLSWLQCCSREAFGASPRALGVAVTSSTASDAYNVLDAARGEIEDVRAAWPADWIPFVDEDATLDRTREALERVKLAHFACHGDFFPQCPDRSGVLLHDGWLRLSLQRR